VTHLVVCPVCKIWRSRKIRLVDRKSSDADVSARHHLHRPHSTHHTRPSYTSIHKGSIRHLISQDTMSNMSTEAKKTGLLDVPTEVILEYLLPELSVNDLARLARVNKFFNDLTVCPLHLMLIMLIVVRRDIMAPPHSTRFLIFTYTPRPSSRPILQTTLSRDVFASTIRLGIFRKVKTRKRY